MIIIGRTCLCGCGFYIPGKGKKVRKYYDRSHYCSTEEFKKTYVDNAEKIRRTMLERYGVANPGQLQHVKEAISRARKKEQENGIDRAYVMHTPEARAKIIETKRTNGTLHRKFSEDKGWDSKGHGDAIRRGMQKKYGVDNPGQLLDHTEKFNETYVKTSMKHWGTSHPAKVQSIKEKILSNRLFSKGPNSFEQKVLDLCPRSVQFCSGKIFITDKNGRTKTPDAYIPGKRKVFEFNSRFYHGEGFTRQTKSQHVTWMRNFYKRAGFKVCIVWDNELKYLNRVVSKINRFVNG